MNLVKSLLFCFVVLIMPIGLSAQLGNFKQMNIEEGLIQSQVVGFTQDRRDFMWIATLGGISIFDGSGLETLQQSDALPSNTIYGIYTDSKQYIWIITSKGVCYYDGANFHNVAITPLGAHLKYDLRVRLIEDASQLYLYTAEALFLYDRKNKTFNKLPFVASQALRGALVLNQRLYVLTEDKGLCSMSNNTLEPLTMKPYNASRKFYALLHQDTLKQEITVYTNFGIEKISTATNSIVTQQLLTSALNGQQPLSFYKDSRGGAWLATNRGGVYCIKDEKLYYYNHGNGFSGNEVLQIKEDNQGNVWLSTNGDGVFRFKYGPFYMYDKHQYFKGQILADIKYAPKSATFYIATNKGNIYSSTRSDSLPKKLSTQLDAITSLQLDPQGDLLVVSPFRKLLKVQNNKVKEYTAKGLPSQYFAAAYASKFHKEAAIIDGQLWWNDTDKWANTTYSVSGEVLQFLDTNTVIIGTLDGLQIVTIQDGKAVAQKILAPGNTIFDVAYNDSIIFAATNNKGLMVYQRSNENITFLNTTKGMSCNFIYNLYLDKDTLWIGTGCGIDRLELASNLKRIVNYSTIHGWGAIEANAGAIEKVGNVYYIATNEGLMSLNPANAYVPHFAPKIILKDLLVFSKKVDLKPYATEFLYNGVLPKNPKFPPSYTHLTFDVKAVVLGANKINYKYQLLGSNDENIYETNQSAIVFSNLQYGTYQLRVWSTNSLGQWEQEDDYYYYDFEILTPFYQTWLFKIALVFFLLAIYFLIRFYLNKLRIQRINREEALKLAEQDRVKQRTAEDFHDEIGNKLTKINLLSSMAQAKAQQAPEVVGILKQLQVESQALYKGAKDIIWSLQPQSKYLHQIIDRIVYNAEEMMSLAAVPLKVHKTFQKDMNWEAYKAIKMDDEVGRNMILIFKEIFNNIIKYAFATEVILQIDVNNQELSIQVIDNGKGFELDSVGEKGNGLANIQRRATRIYADLTISSKLGIGTTIKYHMNVAGK